MPWNHSASRSMCCGSTLERPFVEHDGGRCAHASPRDRAHVARRAPARRPVLLSRSSRALQCLAAASARASHPNRVDARGAPSYESRRGVACSGSASPRARGFAALARFSMASRTPGTALSAVAWAIAIAALSVATASGLAIWQTRSSSARHAPHRVASGAVIGLATARDRRSSISAIREPWTPRTCTDLMFRFMNAVAQPVQLSSNSLDRPSRGSLCGHGFANAGAPRGGRESAGRGRDRAGRARQREASPGRASGALLLQSQRALAYARIYADGNDELSRRLDAVSLPRPARRARGDGEMLVLAAAEARSPVRRRGRPAKTVDEALLPGTDEAPALAAE